MGRLTFLSLTGAVAGIVLGVGALALGGAQAQAPTPEAAVEGAVEAWNAGDAEAFLGFFTPEAFELIVGTEPTVAAVEADMEATGPIASFELSDLRLEGGVFTGVADIQFEAGFSIYELWTFEDTDDGWIIADSEFATRPIPPGVPAVDMALDEYAFIYDEDAINAADGNFAFDVANVGEEPHEVVVLSIDSDRPLLELLAASDPESEEMPEGVEFVTFGGFFEPGQEGTTVFPQPLAPGKYGLVCFVPAPDGTPHAFLGMVSEFTVGSGPVAPPAPTVKPGTGGGITAPNTGDAGLLESGQDGASWLVLGLALTLAIGGTVAVVRSRSGTSA